MDERKGTASSEALLVIARQGDAEALGQLLNRFRDYLLVVAREEPPGHLRRRISESDLVQETFLEAARLFERFRSGSIDDLRPWLRAILHNKAANLRRHHERGRRAVAREIALVDPADLGLPPTAEPSPSSLVGGREQQARLLVVLERLPETARQVVRWRSLEGLPFGETGRRLGCSEKAAGMAWLRAIDRLRREWESTTTGDT